MAHDPAVAAFEQIDTSLRGPTAHAVPALNAYQLVGRVMQVPHGAGNLP